jgi:hypothetical protein
MHPERTVHISYVTKKGLIFSKLRLETNTAHYHRPIWLFVRSIIGIKIRYSLIGYENMKRYTSEVQLQNVINYLKSYRAQICNVPLFDL